MRLPAHILVPSALVAPVLLLVPGIDTDKPAKKGGPGFSCVVAAIHDGDTMRCADGTRVRLSGIDARELDGSCAPGHPCAAADPLIARATLEEMALGQSFTCEDGGATYNRRAGFCRRSDGLDLSCAMLATGTVAKWDRYWKGHSC